jgi:YbbR domain-containing protein
MIQKFLTYFISLFLASLTWLALVSTQQNIKNYEEGIELKYFNLPENLSVSNQNKEVKIKVDTRENLKDIKKNDFQAFVDLSEIKAGEHSLEIQVKSNNPKVRIVSFKPSKIDLKLEENKEREFEIDLLKKGKLNPNYSVDTINFSPKKVKVKGAPSILNQVQKVKLELNFNGESQNFSKSLKLLAVNENNKIISNLVLDPSELTAEVKLTEISVNKKVGVKLNLKNIQTKENFYVESIKFSPQFTEIRGKKYIVNNYDNLQTEEINLTNLDKDISINKKIVSPLYTELIGKKNVNIQIKIKKIAEIKKVVEEKSEENKKDKD